jgi:hypothetical protein
MTVALAEYSAPNVYRLDPFYRWEAGAIVDGEKVGGQFAPKPATLPAPAAMARDISNGTMAAFIVPGDCNYWRVRCVKKADGTWSVVYDEDAKKIERPRLQAV